MLCRTQCLVLNKEVRIRNKNNSRNYRKNMKHIFCFCCKSAASVDLDTTSSTEIPESQANNDISTITYISESPKRLSDETRARTTSITSMKSIKSFYSARSTNSALDDFYSIGSADSFQSVRISTAADENIPNEKV